MAMKEKHRKEKGIQGSLGPICVLLETAMYLCFGQGDILVVVALDEEESSVPQDVAQFTGGIWTNRCRILAG